MAALFMLRRARRDMEVNLRLGDVVGRPHGAEAPALLFGGWPDPTRLLPTVASNRLYQAGIELPADRLTAILIFVLCVWSSLVILSGLIVATVVVLSSLLVVAAIIDYRARKRMNALSDAMLGYFDRVRQLLVVGNSLSVALARATQSSPPIVIEFFSPTIRRIANGAGVAESVNQLADETDLYELRLFGTAIETNLRFGGSLTSILSNLIDNIRRRAAVMREVRGSTSQIRASAWVLGLLPMIVASVVMVQSTDYMRWFIEEPAGRKLLIYCALSQIFGAFMMRNVVRANY
ncbi:type II secretion system protein [Parvibaculum lavamentivorans DS-1]|uniref:Type II secretion system protein n=1 Tax=Parvibaculum lavamentivorans (strain DS-1 / DSM 13023 / NCIMB 13966) TaxID=402881 RepID=A7HP63_PARL1|nr:type II secretion system F family protein [Parvibaculum lavamentivorans]ABS61696.1 type II secretion system protein [Parvibaculum lavamentivorans DS-1]